jgi:hypothetical protein
LYKDETRVIPSIKWPTEQSTRAKEENRKKAKEEQKANHKYQNMRQEQDSKIPVQTRVIMTADKEHLEKV